MAGPDIKELLSLDVQARLELVEELWESISKDAQVGAALPVTDYERRELDERLREDNDDPNSAIPWAQARVKLLTQP